MMKLNIRALSAGLLVMTSSQLSGMSALRRFAPMAVVATGFYNTSTSYACRHIILEPKTTAELHYELERYSDLLDKHDPVSASRSNHNRRAHRLTEQTAYKVL